MDATQRDTLEKLFPHRHPDNRARFHTLIDWLDREFTAAEREGLYGTISFSQKLSAGLVCDSWEDLSTAKRRDETPPKA